MQGCAPDAPDGGGPTSDGRAAAPAAPELLPVQELCCQLSALIRQHEIRERRDRPEIVDQALLGYITLLTLTLTLTLTLPLTLTLSRRCSATSRCSSRSCARGRRSRRSSAAP